MNRLIILGLLALTSCCPSTLEILEHLDVVASSENTVAVYDKASDTWVELDNKTLRVIVKRPHWNHHDE